MMAVIYYRLHFEFFFSFDQVRGWPRVVGPVLARLAIKGQQARMKYIMDGPGRGKSEFVSDG